MATEFYPGQLVKVVIPFTVFGGNGDQPVTMRPDSVCLFLGAKHIHSYDCAKGFVTYLLSSNGLVFYTEWWCGLFSNGYKCYVEPFSHIG